MHLTHLDPTLIAAVKDMACEIIKGMSPVVTAWFALRWEERRAARAKEAAEAAQRAEEEKRRTEAVARRRRRKDRLRRPEATARVTSPRSPSGRRKARKTEPVA